MSAFDCDLEESQLINYDQLNQIEYDVGQANSGLNVILNTFGDN